MRKEAEEKLKNSSEQLRRLAAHLQSSREDERTEFAREVHDELGQALTALKMDIFWIRNRLPENETALIAKANDSLALVDSTIKSVRRICTELRPDILDHLGITAAVEWQIEEFRKRTGIKCSVIIHPREIKISRDLSISVFRIIQEALTNIIRHSGATEVNFAMEIVRNSLSFRISDNGRGIPKKNIHGSKSFGILGIRERVRFWNGNLQIEGLPAKGTTLFITVPLDKLAGPQSGNNERPQDQADIDTVKSLRDNNQS
jgi:signal transduction histidine kinase